jgi:hypothetical protein|uniref:Uncharacterized protein n=1 Tax=viral metagenome TaxID=1070528 RepID=A0A6C0CVD5_9ZZZZ
MTDNKKWVNVFNEKFSEFIKDLIETFPDDKDFKLCKQSFTLLQMVDEKKPVEMFQIYAMKYKEKIMNKEESFFLKHDFKEELSSSDDQNFSVELLLKLKECWKNLEQKNKDVIWSYLELLYKVENKISG